jgi:hypothetical protein
MRESIIKTLSYFDVFQHPLTAEEMYRWLWKARDWSFLELKNELEKLAKEQAIGYKNGFYFLLGRNDTVERRRERAYTVHNKMKIARRAAWLIRFVPFIRALFVCNTVAASSASKKSDVDLFIVVKDGHIWFARLITIVMFDLLGMRIKGTVVADRLCLSFYVSDKQLDLSSAKMKDDDIYMMYWIDQLVPLFDPDNLLKDIYNSNNWVKEYLPNALAGFDSAKHIRVEDSAISYSLRHLKEYLHDKLFKNKAEEIAKKIQLRKFPQSIKDISEENNTNVIVSDKMLKFHQNDRRKYFYDKWVQTINAA